MSTQTVKRSKSLAILLLGLLTLPAQHLMADSNESSSVKANASQEKKALPISGSISLGLSDNFQDGKSHLRSSSWSVGAEVSYEFIRDYSVFVRSAFFQDLRHDKVSDFDDTLIGVKSGHKLGRSVSIAPKIYGVIPTGKRSREDLSLQAGVGASGALSWKVSPQIALGYSLNASAYFYEFEQDKAGEPNFPLVFVNRFSGTWRALEWLSLSVSAGFNTLLPLGAGERSGETKHEFRHTETVAFHVAPELTISAGHTLEQGLSNRMERNAKVDLFHDVDSRIFLDFTYLF